MAADASISSATRGPLLPARPTPMVSRIKMRAARVAAAGQILEPRPAHVLGENADGIAHRFGSFTPVFPGVGRSATPVLAAMGALGRIWSGMATPAATPVFKHWAKDGEDSSHDPREAPLWPTRTVSVTGPSKALTGRRTR
jgi:hypothetical protein